MSSLERIPATFTYDPEAHALYLYLRGPIPAGGVARTVTMDAIVNADLDAEGNVIGVEILNPWPQAEATAVPEEEQG